MLSAKNVTEKKITFFSVWTNFQSILFLGELFCFFYDEWKLSIKFCVLWYPCQVFAKKLLLILVLFANFKPERGRKGSKKHIEEMCRRFPFYIHFRRLHFAKNDKIEVPYCTCAYCIRTKTWSFFFFFFFSIFLMYLHQVHNSSVVLGIWTATRNYKLLYICYVLYLSLLRKYNVHYAIILNCKAWRWLINVLSNFISFYMLLNILTSLAYACVHCLICCHSDTTCYVCENCRYHSE